MNTEKTARILRYSARAILLALGLSIFLFSLFSGSEGYGGGLRGIIRNVPNTLPWMILLVFTLVAFKWELAGGTLIIITGLFAAVFFDFYKPGGFFGLLAITLPLVAMGSALAAASLLSRKPSLQERMRGERRKMSRKAGRIDRKET